VVGPEPLPGISEWWQKQGNCVPVIVVGKQGNILD